MTTAALALVVAAAFLHAAWNALAKRARDQFAFLWCAVLLASALFAAPAVYVLGVEGFPTAAVPFVVATCVLHALYFWALGRAYGAADYSLVYPVARGLGVALVPALAIALFDERLSALGGLGIALVLGGIVALSFSEGGGAAGARGRRVGGIGWAVLTGVTVASYSLVDKAGVARLHPVPYIGLMGLGLCAILLPGVVRRRAAVAHELRVNWRAIVAGATMTLTSYLLVLFAFRLSKVGYVVAARELSIVISAFIGAFWLGEGRLAPRLAGAVVVLAGVVCIALAR